jgi:hypothetical protein
MISSTPRLLYRQERMPVSIDEEVEPQRRTEHLEDERKLLSLPEFERPTVQPLD